MGTDVLQLLQGIGDTHLVLTDGRGERSARALERAARRTVLDPPDLASLVECLSGAPIVHLHTREPAPLVQLAAQLAAPGLLVETVHDDLARDGYDFADFTLFLTDRALALADAPARAERGSSGVHCEERPAEYAPWFRSGAPLTLVEMRLPGQSSAFTVEELLEHPVWADRPVRATVIGVDGPSSARTTYLGAVDDPRPWIAKADFLVCGSSHSPFGRPLLEALACGTPPIATPLDNFRADWPEGRCALYFSSLSADRAARELRDLVDSIAAEPERYTQLREAGFELVRDEFSVERTTQHVLGVYDRKSAREGRPSRNFFPDDVEAGALPRLAAALDSAGDPALAEAACRDLPPRARAVAGWYLAHNEHVHDERRPQLLQESLSVLGPRHVLCHDLGREWKAFGEYEAAVDWFRRAVECDPGRVASYLEWIDAELTCGHVTEGIRVLDRLRENVPQFTAGEEMTEALLAAPTAFERQVSSSR